MTEGQKFYSTSTLACPYTLDDVLAGRVIRLSPALITITDGRMSHPPYELHVEVLECVTALVEHGVRSFHVDINFDDYSGFGTTGPDRNASVFTPEFVADLNQRVQSQDAFLTLHLLTDCLDRHLPDFAHLPLGAVCFQLDVIQDSAQLADLVQQILDIGACASPVIETVGTERLIPCSPAEVRALLEPVLPQIGMLTFQAAGTASRSNVSGFARDQVAAYLEELKPGFGGTIQIQGGITTATISEAVRLGAEFLVCGTQLFRHPDKLTPSEVANIMLREAADALGS